MSILGPDFSAEKRSRIEKAINGSINDANTKNCLKKVLWTSIATTLCGGFGMHYISKNRGTFSRVFRITASVFLVSSLSIAYSSRLVCNKTELKRIKEAQVTMFLGKEDRVDEEEE